MKSSIRAFSLLVGITWSVVPGIDAQVNVVQEHNNLSRDGLYIDSAFTPAAAAGLTVTTGGLGPQPAAKSTAQQRTIVREEREII